MVEQNAKKDLEFADLGYVLVAGEVALAGTGRELLANPEVGKLFLGGQSIRLDETNETKKSSGEIWLTHWLHSIRAMSLDD